MVFQMMFAVITPALITGAFAERKRFKAFVLFSLLWATFVYDPLAHWVWGHGGWLGKMGALDFAGGTVVHISSGVSALVAAWVLGQRITHTPAKTSSRTTSRWSCSAARCSGSAGSASTRAARSPRTASPSARSSTPTPPPRWPR